MQNREKETKLFHRWMSAAFLAPMLFVIIGWLALSALETNLAFESSFGSGDLLAIAAMALILNNQEIERICGERGCFLDFVHDKSLYISMAVWFAFGCVKVINGHIIPSAKNPGYLQYKMAVASIIVLLISFVICIIARVVSIKEMKNES